MSASSVPPAPQAPPPPPPASRTPLPFVSLERDLRTVSSITRALAGSGLQAEQLQVVRDLRAVQALFSDSRLGFALVRPRADADVLSEHPVIRSVLFPPVVAVVDGPIDGVAQQELRRTGVAAVMPATTPPEQLRALLRNLAGASSWIKMPIEKMEVGSALQGFAHVRDALVTVACPHWTHASEHSWDDPAVHRCRLGEAAEPCQGWYGRIYLSGGAICFAETPDATGIPAVAQLLPLKGGEIRIHEIYIDPPSIGFMRSIQGCLIEAAAFADEAARDANAEQASRSGTLLREGGSGSTPRGSGTPRQVRESDHETRARTVPRELPSPPPVDTGRPRLGQEARGAVKQQNWLEAVLTSTSGVRGLATCDPNGWVGELAGTIDAETTSAVVTMSLPPMRRIASLLGLGQISHWALGNEAMTIYAIAMQKGLLTAVGDPTQNLDSVLRALERASGDRR